MPRSSGPLRSKAANTSATCCASRRPASAVAGSRSCAKLQGGVVGASKCQSSCEAAESDKWKCAL
eukprot:7762003-Alexandrium_andersonii.AAC.1